LVWVGNAVFNLDSIEQFGQALLQSVGDFFDIHQRHVPKAPLNPAAIRPVQSAPLGSLFLIDRLLLAYAADGAAKSDADVERRRPCILLIRLLHNKP
jgi:hypothetical protein